MSEMQWVCQLGNGYMLGVANKVLYKVETGYPYPKIEGGQIETLCGMFGLQGTKFSSSVKVLNDVMFPISFLDAFELLHGDRAISVLGEDWFVSVDAVSSGVMGKEGIELMCDVATPDSLTATTRNAYDGDIFFSKDVLSNIFSEDGDRGIFSFFLDDTCGVTVVNGDKDFTVGVILDSNSSNSPSYIENGSGNIVSDSSDRGNINTVGDKNIDTRFADRENGDTGYGCSSVPERVDDTMVELEMTGSSSIAKSDNATQEVPGIEVQEDKILEEDASVAYFNQAISELAVAAMPGVLDLPSGSTVTEGTGTLIETGRCVDVKYDLSLSKEGEVLSTIPIVLEGNAEIQSVDATELQVITEGDVYELMEGLKSETKKYTCRLDNDMIMLTCDGIGVSLGIAKDFVQEGLWGLFSEPSMPKDAFCALDRDTVGVKLSGVIPIDLCPFYFNDLMGRDDYVDERSFSFKKVLDNFLNNKPKSKKKTELLSLYTVKGVRMANKRSKEWGIKSSGRPVCRLVDILYQIGRWEFSEGDMVNLFVKSCGVTLMAISKEEAWLLPFVNVKGLLKTFMRDMRYLIWWLIDDTARLYGYEGYLNFSQYDLVLKARGDNEISVFYRKSLVDRRPSRA